jgi:hypothetical protein
VQRDNRLVVTNGAPRGVTGRDAAGAGALMLAVNIVCAGAGAALGSLAGSTVAGLVAGFLIGFFLAIRVVVKRFQRP